MNAEITCETQGHLWNRQGRCVMCDAERGNLTSALTQAAQVPLEHRLREVPQSLRLIVETDTSLSSTPVGYLCHEAADEIERLRRGAG